jgi:hypothetical protein
MRKIQASLRFDSAPAELADSLLAIAVFCCCWTGTVAQCPENPLLKVDGYNRGYSIV